ncbi:MAG TPA: deoxyribodipyrimidine photo-lyase, partial [Salinimicrobium sp.]|nr:deoxyribodipyrimidine photo-lyase [Salinimicrobium sp.]
FEKSEVMKPDGDLYQVYTPYSKTWKARYASSKPEKRPSEKRLKNLYQKKSFPFLSLTEIGFKKTDVKIPKLQIDEKTIKNYKKHRNFPAMDATSHADVPLRFGTIGVRELVEMAKKTNETFLNELIWREFFMMILYHFPKVVDHNFKKKYDRLQWRNNEEEFLLWCRGETGYPIVDAGMRQLNETGYMHNRVRMVAASFLTKHLLIDWRWGEAYFAEKLLDYELSSNNGNWQWAAGTGCDAAPYFRIFNPAEQTKKFDPDLKYIKAWIKNFRYNYLPPIVEHSFARKRALEVYKKALAS